MKVLLYMAVSLDGFIARKNGSEDFLSNQNWETFVALVNKTGNFIVGSKTYEAVMNWDEGFGFDDFDQRITKIIISRQDLSLKAGYTLAHSPKEALEILTQKGHTQALVSGGSMINSAFIQQGLIDEVMLNINPVVIGSGIPLFSETEFPSQLSLIDNKQTSEGIIKMHYTVNPKR